MDLKEIIMKLSNACGVSGAEGEAAETALSILKEYCPDAEIKGTNVIGRFGDRSADRKLLLEAHMDQIGFIVTYITEDGFVKVGNIGGVDCRLLPAQEVILHGKKDIKGVVVSTPPHLSSDNNKAMKLSDVSIDIGMSRESAEKLISPGDRVTFSVKCRELLGDRITGGALDDRAGCAAVIYALSCLKGEKLPCAITVMLSSEEEVGERGAKTGAFGISPDMAIAVDVSFGYTEGEDEHKCGKLGCGPMIGISPAIDRDISDKLCETAERAGIPYQLEVMGGSTGTDADAIGESGSGVATGLISIPLRYMHTPVEVISVSDVENTGRLIAEYIKGVC